MSRGALQKMLMQIWYEKRTEQIFCTRSEKWSENRSSRFEPKIVLISFSRGSGPPLTKSKNCTNKGKSQSRPIFKKTIIVHRQILVLNGSETRNGHWNTKRNPRWPSQISFHKANLKRNINFHHRGFCLDDHFESHLPGNGLYHNVCFFVLCHCYALRLRYELDFYPFFWCQEHFTIRSVSRTRRRCLCRVLSQLSQCNNAPKTT